eukprot:gnl/MRDRNA2_/MRDRNA2_75591_c0_seq1.p1 gnl/MRDRNA2_/MRDRNA2_75591_c0~~gnl/MRDRNA2_/MRDRNA2_75591_c0_seq1.p1  ORF type:complete len:155 (+),score=28.47 gnl/MRDRNA2_/MRDRNA2_75591_c0_seq1:224-688(+)
MVFAIFARHSSTRSTRERVQTRYEEGNGFINFVADHNEARDVYFGAQQKHMELLEELGAPTDLSTLVVVQNDKVYTHSDAALRVAALLDTPFNGLAAFSLLPQWIRDDAYRFIAKHRYAIFGKTEDCRKPSPDFEERFLGYNRDETPERKNPFR